MTIGIRRGPGQADAKRAIGVGPNVSATLVNTAISAADAAAAALASVEGIESDVAASAASAASSAAAAAASAALVGAPAGDVIAAAAPRGNTNLDTMTGTSSATWKKNTTLIGNINVLSIVGPAADALMVGGGHDGSDGNKTNVITATDPLYRLMTMIGGYDSTLDDGLACTMLAPMHAHIHAGSTHAAILGGSYQQVYNTDYGGAILGTANTVGTDGVASSGWHAIALGGKNNSVAGDGGTTGLFSTIINGTANIIRKTATGAVATNGGRYAVIAGGYSNTVEANNAAIIGGQGNRVGDTVVDPTAIGNHGAIVGGYTNKVLGAYSGIVAGYANVASGARTGIVGGTSQTVSADGSAAIAGTTNTVAATYSATVGGSNHSITGTGFSGILGGSANSIGYRFSGIVGGRSNTVSADQAVALGGQAMVLSGLHSTAAGVSTTTRLAGEQAFAYGAFATAGDAKTFVVMVRREYAGTAAAALYMNDGLGGGDKHVTLTDNTAWHFQAHVTARCSTSGESLAATVTGCIKRGTGAASVALVGTPTVTILGADNSGWAITAVADTAQGSLSIRVQHGDAAKTVRSVARLNITQITY